MLTESKKPTAIYKNDQLKMLSLSSGPGWLLLEDYSDVKDRAPPLRGFFKNEPPTTSRKKKPGI